jgi:hypothetical protein
VELAYFVGIGTVSRGPTCRVVQLVRPLRLFDKQGGRVHKAGMYAWLASTNGENRNSCQKQRPAINDGVVCSWRPWRAFFVVGAAAMCLKKSI